MKIFLYTIFALVAFALNSILCRMALGSDEIDAASFTSIRLVSGAATLAIIALSFNKTRNIAIAGHWLSAFFLFAYAICFSFAYIDLTTGTGALILFGSVQLTMIVSALVKGERPRTMEWLGLLIALAGLVYLVFPGLTSPPLVSSALMAAAGAAWGFYTLRGKGSTDPLAETTGNFVRAVPMVLLVSLPFLSQIHLSSRGILWAVLSGSVASGIGYTVWYAALRHHTATRAAVLQLAVPIIAAGGGILFLSETATIRLLIAATLILGGIALTILGRKAVTRT
jgi:drug/metabolite transporter (DMT)-like permease